MTDPRQAKLRLRLLELIAGADDGAGFLRATWKTPLGPGSCAVPTDRAASFAAELAGLGERVNPVLELVPSADVGGAPGRRGYVLWVCCGGGSRDRLIAHEPAPALTIQAGTQWTWGVWSLREPLDRRALSAALRRLATRVGGAHRQARADAAVAVPGLYVVEDYRRVPVVATAGTAGLHTAAEVLGDETTRSGPRWTSSAGTRA